MRLITSYALRFSITLLLIFSPQLFAQQKEQRVALVIGNNAYRLGALTASVNDARGMAAALTALGFKVTKLEDLNRAAMLRALRTFVGELNSQNAIGVFYFAGHGMQSKGKNYLIPVDADVEHEDDIETQGVDIQYLLDKFAGVRNGMNILILDACRNNPFAKIGVKNASGLAAVDGPPGTLVAFAAAPGQVAIETRGGNGIYTKHILSNIRTPGLPIEEIFKRVRSAVITDTSKAQVPWENTSLIRDFYFTGAPAGKGYTPVYVDAEDIAWEKVEVSRNIYDFISFMRRFPQSRHQGKVLERVNTILARIKPAPPAIENNELKEFLNETHAGIEARKVDKYSAEYWGFKGKSGWIVHEIERGSAVERAGVKLGDIFIKVNGMDATTPEFYKEFGLSIVSGELIEMVVWRNRREVFLTGLAQRASIENMIEKVAGAQLKLKNYNRARVFAEYLAESDAPRAQAFLGILYYGGLGVQKNFRTAENWLLKAAVQGTHSATALLSLIYWLFRKSSG